MKRLAVAAIMAGVVMVCGCDNKQLRDCQSEKSQLKAELDKAASEAAAANDKAVKAEAALAEAKKKDQETQTQAFNAVRTMLEKQQKVMDELNAKIRAKDEEIAKLNEQLAQTTAAPAPAAPAK